jgi:CDP-4-dehydro-6-deoxyglucose reductase
MDRHLSLSQAARLIGVKRAEVQKKIQENKLVAMEGTVKLSDLKKAFPDAQYEDNTMLEKVEKYMEEAVHKMAQSEREGARLDALSRRLVRVNKDLAEERNRANKMEEIIDGIRQHFIELAMSDNLKQSVAECRSWFNGMVHELEEERLMTPVSQLENQIKQFMLPHVRLLPSRHDFITDKSETLLESALKSGLAVDYGCNNGKCGKCKSRLLSGKVEKTQHQDYVFSESEKAQGYILTCSNTALTDITLETEEAVSADDIPLQSINAKIKKIQIINDHVILMTVRPPRSQRLRFLAGQHVELSLDQYSDDNQQPLSAEYSIATCPCEPTTLDFHIPLKENNPFAHAIKHDVKVNDTITINGPHGHFVLDEDSPNSLIFIAWDTGFSAIKSLIENALSLDHADTIHLYWLTTHVEYHYLENQCRAWNDALDNFTYTHIVCEPKTDSVVDSLMKHLHEENKHLLNYDIYISAPGHLNHLLKPLLISKGLKTQNLHFESTFHGDVILD